MASLVDALSDSVATELSVEQTLALIKPDAVSKENEIEHLIVSSLGFKILNKKRVQLSKEQAAQFYAVHSERPFFEGLIEFMSSGPIVALILQKPNAIEDWRRALGPTDSRIAKEREPTSIRAQFGTDNKQNACHGSDSAANAREEIRFFFPDFSLDTIPLNDQAKAYLEQNLYPFLSKGLTELSKAKPENPAAWLGHWLLENNPNKPKVHWG